MNRESLETLRALLKERPGGMDIDASERLLDDYDRLLKFYEGVRSLTDQAFRMPLSGKKDAIDFVNAEDLEVLLAKFNPNPTEDEDASTEAPEAPLPDIDLQP